MTFKNLQNANMHCIAVRAAFPACVHMFQNIRQNWCFTKHTLRNTGIADEFLT